MPHWLVHSPKGMARAKVWRSRPSQGWSRQTNSCTSTWMQEAKTLNCQPCSPEPPQHWHGAFSLHILLEALRSLTDNISEILCSIFLPKWEGSHLLVRRIFCPHIIPTVGSTQLHAEPQFSSCVVALPRNPDLLRHALPSLLGTSHFSMITTSFAPLLHRAFAKALQFQTQLFLSKTVWWLRVFCSF